MNYWLYIPIAWFVGSILCITMSIKEANKYYGKQRYTIMGFWSFVKRMWK